MKNLKTFEELVNEDENGEIYAVENIIKQKKSSDSFFKILEIN